MSQPTTSSPSPPQEPVLPENPPPTLALPAPPLVAVVAANPRRLPPPCWSHDETVALIDAYREKWYTLRRGNLKANHWQEVAEAVAQRCPAASPAKTAVQCRHKMEKLRKRYRTEIQRARSMPVSRFSSSWVHFKRMDAMEKGPNSKGELNSESENDENEEEEEDEFDNNGTGNGGNGNQGAFVYASDYKNGTPFINTRSIHKIYRNGIANSVPNSMGPSGPVGGVGVVGSGGVGGVGAGGFRIRIPTGVSIAQPAPKFYSKVDPQKYGMGPGMSPNLGQNSGVPKVNYGGMPGVGSSSRVVRGVEEAAGVRKRVREPVEEMVAAIKVLGDGFVRMEQMKMEMAREIETMRMEMEMKRTEMILESQQRVVEAFAKAFAEKKKKPKRVPTPEALL